MNDSKLDFHLPVEEAIVGTRDGDVDGDTLLRSLALHDEWLVPGRSTDNGGIQLGVITKDGGGRILEAFSSREALLHLENKEGDEFTSSVVELNGFQWMEQVKELNIDRLNLNPGSDESVYYKREQLEVIEAWGRLGRAESALYYPERVPDHLGALAGYEDYAVVIYGESEEDGGIMLAPDSKERRLGAIFTTFSAANDFVNTLEDDFGEPMRPVKMAPKQWVPLFQRLDVDGLVFNAWSSMPAIAVNKGILEPLADRLKPPN
jgi:hypothetical protein